MNGIACSGLGHRLVSPPIEISKIRRADLERVARTYRTGKTRLERPGLPYQKGLGPEGLGMRDARRKPAELHLFSIQRLIREVVVVDGVAHRVLGHYPVSLKAEMEECPRGPGWGRRGNPDQPLRLKPDGPTGRRRRDCTETVRLLLCDVNRDRAVAAIKDAHRRAGPCDGPPARSETRRTPSGILRPVRGDGAR
jgi:hypothetical protein